MSRSIRFGIRYAVALCAIVAALGASTAYAAPATGPQTIVAYGFESASDMFPINNPIGNLIMGETTTTAYWGRIKAAGAQHGSQFLWCAGKVRSTGATSTFTATYPAGTRGRVQVRLAQLSDYYSSLASFSYKLPSIGAEDTFVFSWNTYDSGGNFLVGGSKESFALTSAWTTVTVDLNNNTGGLNLTRQSADVGIGFYDHNEVGGQTPNGQGPMIDDFAVTGYKYGPIRSLTATTSAGQTELSWPVPYRAAGSTTDDSRTIGYRVWRAPAGTTTWTELTAGGRVGTNSYTDATSDGTPYTYAVQAWDPGSGTGYGVQSPEVTYPARTPATLGAPSGPSGALYMWTAFTTVGSIDPTHTASTTVQIQCSQNKTTILRTINASVAAGSATYSASVNVPYAGTLYIRARHSDQMHLDSYSAWTPVYVSTTVSLPAPKPKTTMLLNHTYATSGTIKPVHSSSTSGYIKIRAYRWDGKKWVYKTQFSVAVTTSGQLAYTTKYTAQIKLTSKGKWKLLTRHSAHANERQQDSAYSSVITVK
jgi:hypothetical protein